MADHEHDELIANFDGVTGAGAERSRFFLEASQWKLDVALASFYEGNHDSGDMDEDVEPLPPLTSSPGGPAAAATREAGVQDDMQRLLQQLQSSASGVGVPAPGGGGGPSRTQRPSVPSQPRTGLATLASLQRDSEGDSSDDDDNHQAFYAGGSQSSGQQVLGPAKKKGELVADMFRKAREHGAEEVAAGAPPPGVRRPGGGGGGFSGTGYKLGDQPTENQGQALPAPAPAAVASDPPAAREVVLRFWRSGFTVGDSPLRSYTDPANVEFLRSVRNGELPQELVGTHGQEIHMVMEDHQREDFVPPKPVAKPFSGQGQMLGSPAPATIGSTAPLSEGDRIANETQARSLIPVSDTEPSTNIQFRLADGSRLVARFNHHHTVNDLHTFINAARPQFSNANYILTLFPNTDLTQKDSTLKDANILNAALIQKIKN